MVHVRCQSRVAGSETKQRFFPAFDFARIVRNRLSLFGIGRFPSLTATRRQSSVYLSGLRRRLNTPARMRRRLARELQGSRFQQLICGCETREFAAGALKPICGLGVVECSQEPFEPIEFEMKHSFTTSPYPVHFLSANDFLNVIQWLGSIWNVFSNFRARKPVVGQCNGINLERPLLCYYTLRSHEDFSGFAREDKSALSRQHQHFCW